MKAIRERREKVERTMHPNVERRKLETISVSQARSSGRSLDLMRFDVESFVDRVSDTLRARSRERKQIKLSDETSISSEIVRSVPILGT